MIFDLITVKPGAPNEMLWSPGTPIFLSWSPGAPRSLGRSPGALNPFGTLSENKQRTIASTLRDYKTVSFFSRFSVVLSLRVEISVRDAGMCDARIKKSHTRREENRVFLASLSIPTHNFHARSRSFMIQFQPKDTR